MGSTGVGATIGFTITTPPPRRLVKRPMRARSARSPIPQLARERAA